MPSSRVQVAGDTVRRPAYAWTATVHALLRHLRDCGVEVPEPLGIEPSQTVGPDGAVGVEVVRFVPGIAGQQAWPLQATDAGLRSAAAVLRRVHDAARSWHAPADAVWCFPARAGDDLTVCHGDPGPWNMVWREGAAVGLIDWDFARPAPALDDITYALDYLAPMRSDEDCVRWHGFATPPHRGTRVRAFLAAYGHEAADISPHIVDAILARKCRTLGEVASLAARGIEPQRTWVSRGFLDTAAEHLSWAQRHRHLLELSARD